MTDPDDPNKKPVEKKSDLSKDKKAALSREAYYQSLAFLRAMYKPPNTESYMDNDDDTVV